MKTQIRYKRMAFIPIILGCLMLIVSSTNAEILNDSKDSSTIAYGQTIEGEISVAGEKDTLTFTADAGDVVLIRMSDQDPDILDPHIELFDPDGNRIADDYSTYYQADILDQALPSNGEYTIIASDWGSNEAGIYGLSMQCVNQVGGSQSISYGYTGIDSIVALSQMDAYRFTAEAGDVVLIRMSDGSDVGIDPQLELFGPDGSRIADAVSFEFQAEILDQILPANGEYTIITSEGNGNEFDTYGLSLQCVNQEGGSQAISYGYSAHADISTLSDMDAYRFVAEAGDVVIIRMSDSSDVGIDPRLELFGPDGSRIADDYSAKFQAEILDQILPASGEYTIIASERYGNDFDTYGLCLQCVNQEGGSQAISYGYSFTTTIITLAQMDAYRFIAEAGDVVLIRMSDDSDVGIDPRLELFGPNGVRIAEASGSTQAEILDQILMENGEYTIVASEVNGNEVDEYLLTLECPKPGINCPATPIDTFVCELGYNICIPAEITGADSVHLDGLNLADDSLCFIADTAGYYTYTLQAFNYYGVTTRYLSFNVVRDHPIVLDIENLTFTTTDTSTAPPEPQALRISSPCDPGGLNWVLTDNHNVDWLHVDKVSGTSPDDITVSISKTGLPAGIYNTELKFECDEALNSPVYVNVSLFVESGVDVGDYYTPPGTQFKVPINLYTNKFLDGFSIPLTSTTLQPDEIVVDSVVVDTQLVDTVIWVDSSTFIVYRPIDPPPLPDSEYVLGHIYFTAGIDAVDEVFHIDTTTVTVDNIDYSYQFVETGGDTVVPLFNRGTIVIGYMCGDANADKSHNLLDILYLIDYVYGDPPGPAPVPEAAGDVNSDGAINLLDILYLINYLYGSPPGPPPLCGEFLKTAWIFRYGEMPALHKSIDNPHLEITNRGNTSVIQLESPVDIAGLELVLHVNNKSVEIRNMCENLQMFTKHDGNEIRLALFDLKGSHVLPAGNSPLVAIDGSVEIVDVLAADQYAQEVYIEITEKTNSDINALPTHFELAQNFPNPFNPSTEVHFALPHSCQVSLEIFNIAGQKVTTLVNQPLDAGYHSVVWNGCESSGNQVASGIYFYRLKTDDFQQTKKMMLLK